MVVGMTSTQIITAIGVTALAAALDVGPGAVREQMRAADGLMPASWFTTVRNMAATIEGIHVVEDMFRFKSPTGAKE
jgi:hypothetical protein